MPNASSVGLSGRGRLLEKRWPMASIRGDGGGKVLYIGFEVKRDRGSEREEDDIRVEAGVLGGNCAGVEVSSKKEFTTLDI